MPSPSVSTAICGSVRVLLPVDGALGDELAADGDDGIDEAARIVTHVDDECLHVRAKLVLEGGGEVLGGVGAEAVDGDVADPPVCQRRGAHVRGGDGVAGDGQLELFVLAQHAEHDLAAPRPTDEPDHVVDGQAVERFARDILDHDLLTSLPGGVRDRRGDAAVDAGDHVAGDEAGLLRRGIGQDPRDRQAATRVDGLAPLAVAVEDGHLRPDTLELAAGIVECTRVLRGRHVARVGVVEDLDHAVERTLQHLLGHGRPDVVVGDALVQLGERLDSGLLLLVAADRACAQRQAGPEDRRGADPQQQQSGEADTGAARARGRSLLGRRCRDGNVHRRLARLAQVRAHTDPGTDAPKADAGTEADGHDLERERGVEAERHGARDVAGDVTEEG